MLSRLFILRRDRLQWFQRARLVATGLAALVTMVGLFIVVSIFSEGPAVAEPAMARHAWLAFSIFPLAVLLALNVLVRVQEVLVMRAGGRAIEVEDDDD